MFLNTLNWHCIGHTCFGISSSGSANSNASEAVRRSYTATHMQSCFVIFRFMARGHSIQSQSQSFCFAFSDYIFRTVDEIFVAFNGMSVLDILFNTLNSVHDNITFTKELECGDSLAFLDVLTEKTQSRIQTTTYWKPTHSGLYTHWTSFIPHRQKRNLVFGLLDRAYKIDSTYNAIHSEFMSIKSILIRNGYPKAIIDRCIMKSQQETWNLH